MINLLSIFYLLVSTASTTFESIRFENPVFVNDSLYLCLGEPGLIKDETACFPVTVFDFENLQSLQFAITFENDVLKYLEAKKLNQEYFMYPNNVNSPYDGNIRFSWTHPGGDKLDLEDGVILFEVCFTVLNEAPPENYIFISSDISGGIEATNIDDQVVPVDISCGLISKISESLYSSKWNISPNPATNQVKLKIPFYKEVRLLRILDQNGRTIVSEKEFNSIEKQIELSNFSAGTYVVELTLDDVTLKKQFIKL